MHFGLISYIKRLIYPNVCPFCNEVIKLYEHICEKCSDEITYIDNNVCAVCGKSECECKNYGHKYERAIIPLEYTRKAVKAVKRFKFYDCPGYAENLSKIMSEHIKIAKVSDKIDMICSVPMTKRDMKRRGYNQSFLLSKNISKQLGIPCADGVLEKIRSTKYQHNLTARERKSNLKGAFAVKDVCKIKDKTVLLVDDVVTTGTTINECASVLMSNGAKRVYVCALCKTKWLKADKGKNKAVI